MPWRAFFLGICLAGSSLAVAAPASRSAPPLSQFGKLDTEEARAALEQLRRQGISGDYFLELQIRVMPRRGEERMIRGQLWGGRNAIGPLTRVALDATVGAAPSPALRLLIQNGRESGAWRWGSERGVEKLSVASLFEPLIADTELTAFDLQMPFMFWERFEYEGLARFRGRPAHVLVLRPPAEFAAKHPALTGVRVHLDTQFNALVRTELLGERDAVTKTLSLVDLKRIGEQWIPKTFDLRDERTRNKTRVSVTAAALDLDFAGTLFEPAMLADPVRPPDPARTTRIEP
jgi:hypothetical protein